MIKFPVYLLLLVTAYTASPDEGCNTEGIMANGEKAVAGVSAAADHLPYGTRLRLPDGSERIIGDRFGGGYTDRLDLFVSTKEEAWAIGRSWMFVEVIDNGNDAQTLNWREFWEADYKKNSVLKFQRQ